MYVSEGGVEFANVQKHEQGRLWLTLALTFFSLVFTPYLGMFCLWIVDRSKDLMINSTIVCLISIFLVQSKRMLFFGHLQ